MVTVPTIMKPTTTMPTMTMPTVTMPTITVDEWRHGSAAVLTLAGPLDSRNAPSLEARLASLEQARVAAVVVDLAGVDYLTGSCLRTLLLAARRMDESGRRLVLCAPRTSVLEVLRISGLTRALHVHVDRATALAELEGRGESG